jgi:hypothetical protein
MNPTGHPQKLSLSQIKGPSEEPPKTPDPKTSKEIRRTRKTPTEHAVRALDRHVAYIKADCEKLQEHVAELQHELDTLRPAHATLRESHRNISKNATFGMVGVVIGSTVLGIGGFITSNAKFYVMIAGIVVTACAVAVQIVNCHSSEDESQSGQPPQSSA